MAQYRVNLWREDSFGIDVEAENEDEALDLGFEAAPYLCAQCSGWGQRGSTDAGDWLMKEDCPDYTEERYGKTVELVGGEE
jgi:hypothetical protein